jgi:hypothetical protein
MTVSKLRDQGGSCRGLDPRYDSRLAAYGGVTFYGRALYTHCCEAEGPYSSIQREHIEDEHESQGCQGENQKGQGGEAVQPSGASASAPREPTRPQPCPQQDTNSQITTGAPSNTPDRVTQAQLADKLREVTTIALRGRENKMSGLLSSG